MNSAEFIEQLGDSIKGWTTEPVFRAGREVGLFLYRGTEAHFMSFDEKHAISRKNATHHLSKIFDEYGFVTTRVPIEETDHRLREILGFQFQWSDEKFTYWILTQLPWGKHEDQRNHDSTPRHLH